MAELNVVRKKKSPLPWILLVLLVLAIIAFLMFRDSDDTVVGNEVQQGADTTITYDTTGTSAP